MKKRVMRLAAFALSAVMGLSLMAGCTGTTPNEGEDKATQAPAANNGQLIMGTNAAFPPFEFTTSNGLVGEFDGIDVAIAQKIAASMGKTLKIEDMEFEGLVASVKSGKIDMAVAGMTATEERALSVDFSDPYFTASQVILVSPDNTAITNAESLKNAKNVGVVLGYTGDTYVTETLALSEDKIVRVGRGIDAVQDVKNKKLEAVVIDSATGKALAEKNSLKVVEDEKAFETEQYAIAVQKGNTELLEQINKVLKEMKDSGEITELAVKYNSADTSAAE